MIHMTKQAAKEIRERFPSDRDGTVRVRVAPKKEGCGGYLTLRPDSPTENDEVLEVEGVTVVADNLLVDSLGGIQINFAASPWGGGNLTARPLVNLETGTCGDCRC